jgi:hypothetical protein
MNQCVKVHKCVNELWSCVEVQKKWDRINTIFQYVMNEEIVY